jgi:hypothetical protein
MAEQGISFGREAIRLWRIVHGSEPRKIVTGKLRIYGMRI